MRNAPSSYDPPIRTELLAVALDRSREGIDKGIRGGHIPPKNITINGNRRGWTLSTLRDWNPRVAKRLELILVALI